TELAQLRRAHRRVLAQPEPPAHRSGSGEQARSFAVELSPRLGADAARRDRRPPDRKAAHPGKVVTAMGSSTRLGMGAEGIHGGAKVNHALIPDPSPGGRREHT